MNYKLLSSLWGFVIQEQSLLAIFRPEKNVQNTGYPVFYPLYPIMLALIVGQYIQHRYLKGRCKKTLTATVTSFAKYLPYYFPLPHPSPRNNIWLKQNPRLEKTVILELQTLCNKYFKLNT